MAIVGQAEVVIRAIGDKLESDIQNALNKAAKGAKTSGNDAGENWSEGFNKSVTKNVDTSSITQKIESSVSNSGVASGKKVANGVKKGIKDATPELSAAGAGAGNKIGDSLARGVNRGFRRRGLVSIAAKIGLLIPIIGILGGAISSLVSGLFAMISVMGSATQASASLLGALSALGQAAFVGIVGFKGVGKAIAAGFDPERASEFQKALAKLPKPAQEFVKEFVKFGPVFKEIKEDITSGLFTQLSPSLQRVIPLFGLIRDEAEEMGAALGTALDIIVSEVTTPTALISLGNIIRSNNEVIVNFGVGIGGLSRALIALLDAARPLTEGLSEAFSSFSQNIAATLEAKNASGELTATLIVANNAFQIIWRSVKNLSAGLFEMGKIAKPAGLALFESFEGATRRFREFASAPENSNRLDEFFENTKNNTLAISRLLADLGQAFLRLGANPAIADTAKALSAIVPNLERMLAAGVGLGPSFANLIGAFADLFTILEESEVLRGVISLFADLTKALTEILSISSTVTNTLLALFAAMKLHSLFTKGAVAVGLFGQKLLGLIPIARDAGTAVSLSTQRMLATQQANLAASGGFIALNSSVKGASTSLSGAAPVIAKTRTALSGLAKTAGPIGLLTLAISGVGKESGVTAAATGAFVGSLAGPWGAAAGAVIGYSAHVISARDTTEKAVKRMNEALRSGDTARQQRAIDDANKRIAKITEDIRQANAGVADEDFELIKRTFSGLNSFFHGDGFNPSAGLEEELGKLSKTRKDLVNEIKRTQEEMQDALNGRSLDASLALRSTFKQIEELKKQFQDGLTLDFDLDSDAAIPTINALRDLRDNLKVLREDGRLSGTDLKIATDAIAGLGQAANLPGPIIDALTKKLTGVGKAIVDIPVGKGITIDTNLEKVLLDLGLTQFEIDHLRGNTITIDAKTDQATADIIAFLDKLGIIPEVKGTEITVPGSALATDALNTLLQLMGALPPGVSIPFGLPGADGAINQTSSLSGLLSGLPSSKAIPVSAPGLSGVVTQLASLKTDLSDLTSGTHNISVNYKISKSGSEPRGGEVVEAATGGLIRAFKMGGIVQKFGPGGRVFGAGTGTSDSVPALLSNGEFVVRASQTKKYLQLLQAINSGSGFGFAEGRRVGTTSTRSSTPRTGDSVNNFINNNYYGPTTGSDRLKELDWTLRFAPRFGASSADIGGN